PAGVRRCLRTGCSGVRLGEWRGEGESGQRRRQEDCETGDLVRRGCHRFFSLSWWPSRPPGSRLSSDRLRKNVHTPRVWCGPPLPLTPDVVAPLLGKCVFPGSNGDEDAVAAGAERSTPARATESRAFRGTSRLPQGRTRQSSARCVSTSC